jgi:hypothetical protein
MHNSGGNCELDVQSVLVSSQLGRFGDQPTNSDEIGGLLCSLIS